MRHLSPLGDSYTLANQQHGGMDMDRIKASAGARRHAEHLKVDLQKVTPANGRLIVKQDVEDQFLFEGGGLGATSESQEQRNWVF